MRTTHGKRTAAIGAAFGAGVAAVVVAGLAAFAGNGQAAGTAKPVNQDPPIITGTPQEGQTLHGTQGNWSNSPTDYNYYWLRCDTNAGNCSNINGAGGSRNYKLTSVDVGNRIKFRVQARNSDGPTNATSAPTTVIKAATAPPPPPPATGCPPKNGSNPDQASAITPPARLLVDTMQSDPQVVTSSVGTLVVRFHVTSSCGGPVQGALVYATATPYNQFTIPPEVPTGADGWAELRFQRMSGFPVSSKQQLIALFVRARKPGENLLGGISTRRLVSLRANLHG